MLRTEDAERLRDFYESLGFTQSMEYRVDDKLNWLELAFLGSSIMIQQTNESHQKRDRDIELYFIVEDVEGLLNTWRRRGIDVPNPYLAFYGMNQVFLRDPDGRRICFESATKGAK